METVSLIQQELQSLPSSSKHVAPPTSPTSFRSGHRLRLRRPPSLFFRLDPDPGETVLAVGGYLPCFPQELVSRGHRPLALVQLRRKGRCLGGGGVESCLQALRR